MAAERCRMMSVVIRVGGIEGPAPQTPRDISSQMNKAIDVQGARVWPAPGLVSGQLVSQLKVLSQLTDFRHPVGDQFCITGGGVYSCGDIAVHNRGDCQ